MAAASSRGLIDEFSVTLAPVLFGTGIRLPAARAPAASRWTRPARTHRPG